MMQNDELHWYPQSKLVMKACRFHARGPQHPPELWPNLATGMIVRKQDQGGPGGPGGSWEMLRKYSVKMYKLQNTHEALSASPICPISQPWSLLPPVIVCVRTTQESAAAKRLQISLFTIWPSLRQFLINVVCNTCMSYDSIWFICKIVQQINKSMKHTVKSLIRRVSPPPTQMALQTAGTLRAPCRRLSPRSPTRLKSSETKAKLA